ncbi:MAG: RluA family pseudouridine synthase [Bacteroidales bacterium]|nr:RluA family pseudouridine synthase [Bacteroidales bacterium]
MEYRELSQEEFDDIAGRILYEDNHILIFNKRVGEIVQGDKTGDEPLSETLKAFIALRDSKPGRVFMGVPHRLDRPVSGVAMFAKTSKALERLNEAFRAGDVHKTYWALSANRPEPESAEICHFLVRNEKQNKSYAYADKASAEKAGGRGGKSEGAKEARLRYKVIEDTERYHLIEVELLTGRHHQIRCQLSTIGCPIKGDLKYGAPRSNKDGGICLHARSINFVHPVRKEEINVVAPVDWSPIICK